MKDDDEIEGIRKDINELKIDRGIKEGIHIRCMWLQTSVLGWGMAAGVMIVNHWDRAMAVMIAVLKSLHDSSKP